MPNPNGFQIDNRDFAEEAKIPKWGFSRFQRFVLVPGSMPPRQYSYVGPHDIRHAAATSPAGTRITSRSDLVGWMKSHASDKDLDGTITATFVIDGDGTLRLAPRRSEHVACASGGPVLSAGEITLAHKGDVAAVSNQSTGFCPEPESWPQVADALDRIPISHPGAFTSPIVFRLCPKCDERNIVKDHWFVCAICGADLPAEWNFQMT
jgi:hypothetical protein